jgi:hypothetical protein
MHDIVTVDEALSRGRKMITIPGYIIMFGTIGLGLYLGSQKILPFWVMPISLFAGFGLAWLWWSFMITKWRLWAFENVRNVHELKKRAIQEKLIREDNSFFSKTEIRSESDKEKWYFLQSKFKQEDLFQDDLTIPDETIIYYSKGKNLFEMLLMLACLGAGIYLILIKESYVFGSILSVVGAFLSYREFKEATNRQPQIILNDKGIQTVSTEFYEWSEISDEDVISEGSGKHTYYYLTYQHPTGAERLQIDDYNTDQKKLTKLLILYRGRNSKKEKNRYNSF